VKGCADEVIGEQLANLVGTKHRFFEIDGRYLGEFVANLHSMVSLTDGMYLSHGLTEMLALQFLEQAEFSVLLRGHGGELAKAALAWPLHTDERIHAMRSKEELVPYLGKRLNYIGHGVPMQQLFTAEWCARLAGGARRSLEESIADTCLSPADLCSYLYLKEHHRRFTVASLELFRNLVEVRLPFVDDDFLHILFRCPARRRDGTAIHRAIIRANFPALLSVRNSNTGARANAGHNFERWMTQQLIESVERVLLAPDSLGRKIYNAVALRHLIDETKRGAADYGYLLQILLILELWQRDNL
jgi:asparagine synthase (glutamine-hydrolysing)